VRPCFPSLALGRDGAGAGTGTWQCGHVAPQLLVALLHLPLIKIVGVHRLLQFEQNILFPVPLQTLHDLLFAGLTAAVAQLGQDSRVPLSLEQGADDRLPTHPANIAQDIVQLHIHLDQGLLHLLDAPSGIANVLDVQPPQGAHRVDFWWRQKTRTQESIGVQLPQPLTFLHVTFSSGHVLGAPRIHQIHFQTMSLQDIM